MNKSVLKSLAIVLALTLIASAFVACAPKVGLEKVKKAGKLVVLTSSGFAPYEYLGANNEVVGVDMDIAKAIADEIGVKLEVVDMDFDGIVMAVKNGKGDLGASGMTNTEERAKSVDFSINYVDAAQVIIVPEGSAIKTAADLEGKNVGVQMGTTGDIYVTDNAKAKEVFRYKTGPDAGAELANGKIDAVVIDEMPAQQIANANPGLVVLTEPLTEEQYAIAMPKGAEDLKAVVDKVLQKMIDDGSLAKLIEQHKAASGS